MFRFIIGYTLIFTAFTTIAASSAVAAPKKVQQVTAGQKQCLIAAGFWQARARKLRLSQQQVEAIAVSQAKQCAKGAK